MNKKTIIKVSKQLIESNHSIYKKLKYSFLTGSTIYDVRNANSDLDINLVFVNDFFADKGSAVKQIRHFINTVYCPLHEKSGRKVDNIYPGEYISDSQIKASIKGAGFLVKKDKLFLPKVTEGYWESSEDTWYRAWLGALAFSLPITGLDNYKKDKTDAQLTVLIYLLQNNVDMWSGFTSKDIIQKIYNYRSKTIAPFGVYKKYNSFEEVHLSSIRNTLLDSTDLFHRKENDVFEVIKENFEARLRRLIDYSSGFSADQISEQDRLTKEEVFSLSI